MKKLSAQLTKASEQLKTNEEFSDFAKEFITKIAETCLPTFEVKFCKRLDPQEPQIK